MSNGRAHEQGIEGGGGGGEVKEPWELWLYLTGLILADLLGVILIGMPIRTFSAAAGPFVAAGAGGGGAFD